MKLDRKDFRLYLITDRRWLKNTLAEDVEEAILGGVSLVQIREKDLSDEDFIKVAQEIKEITDRYDIPLIINDNVKVALEVDAHGIHVGQDDMDIGEIREILGEDKIIGLSANTVKDAQEGERLGADYLGIGSVFSTGSKDDAELNIGTERLKEVAQSVDIPTVAIGGITLDNIREMEDSGIDGIAVISAILKNEDKKESAKKLDEELKRVGI